MAWDLYGSTSCCRNRSSPCKAHRTGTPQAFLDLPGHSGKHGIGELDYVGSVVIPEPSDQLGQLLALSSLLSLQHGDRERSQVLRPGGWAETGKPVQQGGSIEEAVQHPGGMPENGCLLLQVDVDAPVENAAHADVGVICAQGRVGRNEGHLGAQPLQGRRQSVVADTASAVHTGGARGDIRDPHPSSAEKNFCTTWERGGLDRRDPTIMAAADTARMTATGMTPASPRV